MIKKAIKIIRGGERNFTIVFSLLFFSELVFAGPLGLPDSARPGGRRLGRDRVRRFRGMAALRLRRDLLPADTRMAKPRPGGDPALCLGLALGRRHPEHSDGACVAGPWYSGCDPRLYLPRPRPPDRTAALRT